MAQESLRPRKRHGASVTSLPTWTRVLLTLPFAVPALVCLLGVVVIDSPVRMFAVLPLVFLAYGAHVLLPHVWATSDAYRKDRWRDHRLERELRQELAQATRLPAEPTDPAEWRPGSPTRW